MKGLVAVLVLVTLYPAGCFPDETPETLLETTTSQADLTLVDPELSQTSIPKLVMPPAAPPIHVHLPELVVKTDEWRGSQCGVVEPRFAVFRHPDKWAAFWEKALAPISRRLAKVPPVDFNKAMVVGVFMGEMPYPYYGIEIRSIQMENRPDAEKVLVVRYREITRMIGVFVPPFTVQPFHLKKGPCLCRPGRFFEGKALKIKPDQTAR